MNLFRQRRLYFRTRVRTYVRPGYAAPACARSGRYRCPLPPAENRLAVAIRAGETTCPTG